LLGDLATRNGFPVLDDRLQTSVPGLFVTSLAATQDFGSFFGFTVSARTAALLIVGAVAWTSRSTKSPVQRRDPSIA
jgi:hypothetical protein